MCIISYLLLSPIILLLLPCFLSQVVQRGLAWGYPGDIGLKNDPSVLHFERFNVTDLSELEDNWDSIKGLSNLRLVTDVPAGAPYGSRAIRMDATDNGQNFYTRLLGDSGVGHDLVYLRFYAKFDPECQQVHHYAGLGGYNPPTPWPQGGAGIRPSGDDTFRCAVEPHGTSWEWDYYTYWKDMGCWGNPIGECHGNVFLYDRPDLKPDVVKGQWFSWELMVKLNVPESSFNGEATFWIDGVEYGHVYPGLDMTLVADKWSPDSENGDPFQGFQWSTTPNMKINFAVVELYVTRDPGCVAYFDHIVVATEYIGPMRPAPTPESVQLAMIIGSVVGSLAFLVLVAVIVGVVIFLCVGMLKKSADGKKSKRSGK